jgi:hypothetical protein
MNTQELLKLITIGGEISLSESEHLKKLSEKYPYSQLFSILYLKAISTQDKELFSEEIEKYAYKVSDRTKLFDLIQQQTIFTKIETEETHDKEIPFTIETNKLITEDKIDSTHESDIKEQEIIIKNTNKTEIKIDKSKDKIELDQKINETEIPIAISTKQDEIPLEVEILSNVLTSAFSFDFTESDELTQEKKYNLAEEPIKTKKEILVKPKKFSDWLKIDRKEETDKIEPLKKINDDRIIKFIQEEPSIQKPTKEFYSPIKQAQRSLDDENVQYSETLATILAMQGNFPKAIKAFEQLCLTFPEKKTYFVQKIEELKNKANS